jgi:glutamyl-tRNA synthetase
MSSNIRLRFAPSPTGPLHIGGLRTALFNYLIVKKLNGKLILRIEDTDQGRLVEGSQKYIEDSLSWAGITCDESPKKGGEYGPYNQSERKAVYSRHIDELIEKGLAYYAFDTKEELDAHRKDHELKGKTFIYNSHNRHKLKNSLTISGKELENKIKEGNYVVRFMTEENRIVKCKDLIRGEVSVSTREIDDKILFKSDGMPTYHLANVVDDHLMKISHVIRGEEWLPSLALHVLLYEAFEWEKPLFAHLPLILKPTGKGKLSKRDGAKFGFPVYPLNWEENSVVYKGFKEEGYLAEALNNYMAFLGWSNEDEKEVYSLNELIESFSIDGINKSGAKFDPEKLLWLNSQHIQSMGNEKLSGMVSKEMNVPIEKASKIAVMIKPRLEKLYGLKESFNYLLNRPEFDEKAVSKLNNQETKKSLEVVLSFFENNKAMVPVKIKEELFVKLSENNIKPGKTMPAIRVALVGKLEGPDLFELIAFFGNEDVVSRLSVLNKRLNE